jgi:hypothetical protein
MRSQEKLSFLGFMGFRFLRRDFKKLDRLRLSAITTEKIVRDCPSVIYRLTIFMSGRLLPSELGIPLPDFSDSLDCPPLEQTDHRYPIPVLSCSGSGLPRISASTFAKLLRLEYEMYFTCVIVLDGRFPYEFQGGHVMGSTNLLDRKQLFTLYEKHLGQRVCIVIHCELSVNRGPKWGSIFREIDRERNLKEQRMDKLNYPNVFILDGGYAAFYREHSDLTTGGYRSMSGGLSDDIVMQRRCQARYDWETREISQKPGKV